MQLNSILRHKHDLVRRKQTLNSPWIITLSAVVAVSVLPGNALAFETNLLISPTPRIVAYFNSAEVTSLESDQAPEFAGYTPGAVIAQSTPITKSAPLAPVSIRLANTTSNINPVAPFAAPTNGSILVLEGEASFYSRAGCLGCDPRMIMANGQPLNDNALTMAIGADRKHLVGRNATVTSLATGKSVTVLITDTGGFYQAKYGHRVADLTIATKQAIGMAGGVGQVRVSVH